MKSKVKKAFKTIFLLLLFTLMLLYPKYSLHYAATGLKLWLTCLVPTMLPFMILSGLLIRQHLTESFVKVFYPLFSPFHFSKNGVYCIVTGFLCGFPMGARVIAELFQDNRLSKREATLLLAFCNNIGPAYYISFLLPMTGLTVRGPLFSFLFGMYGIPLLYGLFLSRKSDSSEFFVLSAFETHTESFLQSLDTAMTSAIAGVTTLGGYMVFFNLLNLFPHSLFLLTSHPLSELPSACINCVLEISSGISRIGSTAPLFVLLLLPFGGLSCIAQTASAIKNTTLSLKSYLLHKLNQTLLTAVYYFLLFFFLR